MTLPDHDPDDLQDDAEPAPARAGLVFCRVFGVAGTFSMAPSSRATLTTFRNVAPSVFRVELERSGRCISARPGTRPRALSSVRERRYRRTAW